MSPSHACQCCEKVSSRSAACSKSSWGAGVYTGSYVSFEAALQFHGLYDGLLQTATSVAHKDRAAILLQGHTYRFVKTTMHQFFGFEEHTVDGLGAKVATTEKALIDMSQFVRRDDGTGCVAEILAENWEILDQARLTEYLLRSSLVIRRTFGLLLDGLQLPYDPQLETSAQRSATDSRLSTTAQTYSAKWRLYYERTVFGRFAT